MYPLPLSATLDDRLDAWRNAPGRGWEPADFVAWNLQTCGKVIPNHNKLSFPFLTGITFPCCNLFFFFFASGFIGVRA
jgi:hypothetical protein